MFVEMWHDEEDQAFFSPDSESEISDTDDLDYKPFHTYRLFRKITGKLP